LLGDECGLPLGEDQNSRRKFQFDRQPGHETKERERLHKGIFNRVDAAPTTRAIRVCPQHMFVRKNMRETEVFHSLGKNFDL
jgi:hypothetical protein